MTDTRVPVPIRVLLDELVGRELGVDLAPNRRQEYVRLLGGALSEAEVEAYATGVNESYPGLGPLAAEAVRKLLDETR